jgi:hypothetical protein
MMKGFIITIIVCTLQCKVSASLAQTIDVTIENLNCLPVFFMGEFSGQIKSTIHMSLECLFNLDGHEMTWNEI